MKTDDDVVFEALFAPLYVPTFVTATKRELVNSVVLDGPDQVSQFSPRLVGADQHLHVRGGAAGE